MDTAQDKGGSSTAALAKGGRTNFLGFLLRLGARLPFLVLAARLYGAEGLGRFAYATMVVEFVAALATLGLKRGLAAEMARDENVPLANVLLDGLLLTVGVSLLGSVVLALFPGLMLPDGVAHPGIIWLALIVPFIVVTDVVLAALAYRHRIDVTVHARSVVEPWVLMILSVILAYTAWKEGGLIIAYAASMVAACLAAIRPVREIIGRPQGWTPSLSRVWAMAHRNLPLAGADFVEWATRRIDVFLLGRFAGAEVVGIYYVAQQVATLAGKIRVSFDPILAPMLSVALKGGRMDEAAAHIRQVGFWVLAFQFPVVLALGLPGEGVMGLFGPEFAMGAMIMALLLSAELAAANSSISEMGLIYTHPRYNVVIAGLGLAFQAIVSLFLISRFGGEGAAGALVISLIVVGFVRQRLLQQTLGADTTIWRWSLLAAGVAAFGFGYAARGLAELPQMLVAIPGVLLVFGAIMWRWGFGAADKALFARKAKTKA